MTRPDSVDLRERVATAVLSDRNRRKASSSLDVSAAVIVKWPRQDWRPDNVVAERRGGHRLAALASGRTSQLFRLVCATASRQPRCLWLLLFGLLVAFASGPVVAQDTVRQLNPGGQEVYELGTTVTGPCEFSGQIPQGAGCGAAGTESFAAVEIETSGWSASISPPECKPVKLEQEGRYNVMIFKTSSDWVGNKCYPNIGKVYFARSNPKSSMIQFSFEVGPGKDACAARQPEWSDRIEAEAKAYRQALEAHLLKRASQAGLGEQLQSDIGIVRRQAEMQKRIILEGLDMLRDDCVRIGNELSDELNNMCGEIADCGADIANAIRTGPGATCLAVHEVFTSFRGGANSGQQAYDWFKRDAPCIAKLYDESSFLDMIEALSKARQPLAGFSADGDGDGSIYLPDR